MNYLLKSTFSIIIAISTFLFVGCGISDSGSNTPSEVSVKMKIASTSTTAKSVSDMPSFQSVDSLTEVKMLVEELQLESTADDDSLDFEVDNFVANLPLDGSEFTITSGTVPNGSYDEFEMEIEHEDNANINDPDFNNESDDDDGYTIVIKGVYNGEDFTYKSEEDFEIEFEFNPPLEVTGNSSPSVSININPAGWFKDSSGNDLDPTDPANREKIDNNIENSFDAEYDEDEEDDDDDEDDDDEDNDDDDD